MWQEAEVDPTATKSPGAAWSEAQRAAILEEMSRLTEDPTFKHSKRCIVLLRWLVDFALKDSCATLKERTLGIEVFGRAPSYDTNADPVVRMAANEIRKRLAQYYQEPNRQHGIRIRLVAGSYLPEFDFSSPGRTESYPAETQLAEVTYLEGSVDTEPATRQLSENVLMEVPAEISLGKDRTSPSTVVLRHTWIFILVALVLLAGGLFAVIGADYFRSNQYLFWAPLLRTNTDTYVCLSDDISLHNALKQGTVQGQVFSDMIALRHAPQVTDPGNFTPASLFGDVNTSHKIAVWLARRGTESYLRPSSELTLAEIRHKPTVLIGSFENRWLLILLAQLRFSLQIDSSTHTLWIHDKQNPLKRDWSRIEQPGGEPTVDYAVITRFWDVETDNWVVGIAGLGQWGTEAAGQVLTNPGYASLLPAASRSSKNFQIVLKTTVIDRRASNPQVLAFHAW